MPAGLKNVCGVLKALGDGPRLRMVYVLMDGAELCVCQLTAMLGLSMATVSKHLSILQTAGLVASRKEERWVYYRLGAEFPAYLRKWIAAECEGLAELAADQKNLKAFSDSPEQAIAVCRRQKSGRPARKT